ncbi:hypothetical protein BKA82DRAFT_373087 [Pisolithus tinctorius]|nr:hypothetical protein BKA82DRAFT_373087 [Pisolithus tinctorius]
MYPWYTHSVAFLTTTPPTPYAAWDKEFPYAFIACASGSVISSAASGLGLIMYLGVMTHQSVMRLKGNVLKRWAAVVLMTIPTLFLFITAGCAFLAWLGAVCAHCDAVSDYSHALLVLLPYHNAHLVVSGYLALE